MSIWFRAISDLECSLGHIEQDTFTQSYAIFLVSL